jgi:hypothetical protein
MKSKNVVETLKLTEEGEKMFLKAKFLGVCNSKETVEVEKILNS